MTRGRLAGLRYAPVGSMGRKGDCLYLPRYSVYDDLAPFLNPL